MLSNGRVVNLISSLKLVSYGATGTFSYFLERKSAILLLNCPLDVWWDVVSFYQQVFLQFYYKTIILLKIANFQVLASIIKNYI